MPFFLLNHINVYFLFPTLIPIRLLKVCAKLKNIHDSSIESTYFPDKISVPIIPMRSSAQESIFSMLSGPEYLYKIPID